MYVRCTCSCYFPRLGICLKLGLLKGKGLFFVNTTDGGYRLKLFLEQFHIRSAVLNAELPLRSRLNIIEQFNIGNFDYLIATDESTDVNSSKKDGDDDDEGGNKKSHNKKRKRGSKKDSEYGVSRGLDFRGVSFVVNVDFPPNSKSYTHRIGRTARGGASGVALSLVEAESEEQLEALQQVQESQPPLPSGSVGVGGGGPSNGDLRTATGDDEDMSEDEEGKQSDKSQFLAQPSPLEFDLNELEGFRYRVEDVSRAVTKVAVRETRAAELRAEILNSDRLSSHFEENPSDLQLLQHDRQATHVSKIQDHLKNVPKYMLPRGMQVAATRKRRRKKVRRNDSSRNNNSDPLQSYDAGGVTLDGVAGGVTLDGVASGADNNDYDPETADAEFFDDGSGDGGTPKEAKEKRIFMDTSDGTGKSASGRNAWKEKRNKGKFSRSSKKGRGKL
uniref:RNA helicase n=1 Tax=Ditylum brightwellii TaxID=49249 RepID=A0A6V2D6B0_9STRA